MGGFGIVSLVREYLAHAFREFSWGHVYHPMQRVQNDSQKALRNLGLVSVVQVKFLWPHSLTSIQ